VTSWHMMCIMAVAVMMFANGCKRCGDKECHATSQSLGG
jgi:hypothetical protein